ADLRIAVDPRIAADLRQIVFTLDVSTQLSRRYGWRPGCCRDCYQRSDAAQCPAIPCLHGVAFHEFILSLLGHRPLLFYWWSSGPHAGHERGLLGDMPIATRNAKRVFLDFFGICYCA